MELKINREYDTMREQKEEKKKMIEREDRNDIWSINDIKYITWQEHVAFCLFKKLILPQLSGGQLIALDQMILTIVMRVYLCLR